MNVVMSTHQSLAHLMKVKNLNMQYCRDILAINEISLLKDHEIHINNALFQQFPDTIAYNEIIDFSENKIADIFNLFYGPTGYLAGNEYCK